MSEAVNAHKVYLRAIANTFITLQAHKFHTSMDNLNIKFYKDHKKAIIVAGSSL